MDTPIVKSPVLIEPGVTVRVGPGTQMQWGGLSDDPYNPGPQNGNIIVRGNLRVEGTSSQPVSFFPSYLVAWKVVTISVSGAGTADMTYVKVRNPNLNGLRNIDHGYFDWDFGQSTIVATQITASVFHKLRGGGLLSARSFDRCLFDAGWLQPEFAPYWNINHYLEPRIYNCTFLQDNENNRALTAYAAPTTGQHAVGQISMDWYMGSSNLRGISNPVTWSNHTYVTLPAEFASLRQADLVAQYFGGHVASISNTDEQAILTTYVAQPRAIPGAAVYLIGLSGPETSGDYRWTDGSPVSYINWASNYPIVLPPYVENVVAFGSFAGNGQMEWVGTWKNMEAMYAARAGGGQRELWGRTFVYTQASGSLDYGAIERSDCQRCVA